MFVSLVISYGWLWGLIWVLVIVVSYMFFPLCLGWASLGVYIPLSPVSLEVGFVYVKGTWYYCYVDLSFVKDPLLSIFVETLMAIAGKNKAYIFLNNNRVSLPMLLGP